MIKHLVKRGFLVLLAMILMVLMFQGGNTLACTNFDDYTASGTCLTIVGGIGSRSYRIDSTASSFSTEIQAAASSWVTASTKITSLTLTTSPSATFSVYYRQEFPIASDVRAVTYFYNANGLINGGGIPTSSWTFNDIVLNSPTFAAIGSTSLYTASQAKQGTVAHEFGHALGLDHARPTQLIAPAYHRLMYFNGKDRTTFIPHQEDVSVINHLY